MSGIEQEAIQIAKLRTNLNLSLRKFAEQCGYSSTYIGKVEKGDVQISPQAIRKISETYGVSEAWLRGEEENQLLHQIPGERVRQVYIDSGLSQREFCTKIGSSTSNLYEIMEGKRTLTPNYAKKIEQAYRVGADWLLYGNEDAKEYPCSDEVIRYLKRKPDLRKMLWDQMNSELDKEK